MILALGKSTKVLFPRGAAEVRPRPGGGGGVRAYGKSTLVFKRTKAGRDTPGWRLWRTGRCPKIAKKKSAVQALSFLLAAHWEGLQALSASTTFRMVWSASEALPQYLMNWRATSRQVSGSLKFGKKPNRAALEMDRR